MTRDPAGILGGVDPYTYVGNNPVEQIDPSGLYNVGQWLKGVGGIWSGLDAIGGSLAYIASETTITVGAAIVVDAEAITIGAFVALELPVAVAAVGVIGLGVGAWGLYQGISDYYQGVTGPGQSWGSAEDYFNAALSFPFAKLPGKLFGEHSAADVFTGALSDILKLKDNLAKNLGDKFEHVVDVVGRTLHKIAGALGCPHFTTYDGLQFDFQGAGEFIAARSTQPGDNFQVQLRIEPEGSAESSVSIITQIGVAVGNDRVTFAADRSQVVWVDGVAANISQDNPVITLPGGTVTELSSNDYIVALKTGEIVTINPFGDGMGFTIALPENAAPGSVQGFLGPDEGQADTFTLPDGTLLQQPLTQDQLYQTFANAWRITQSGSLMDYGPGQTTATFTDDMYPREILTLADLPPDLVAAAAAIVAAAGITDPALAASAIFDYITMGDPNIIAEDAAIGALETSGASAATITAPSAPAPSLGIAAVVPQTLETAGAVTAVTFDINLTSAVATNTVVDYAAVTPAAPPNGESFLTAADFGGTLPSGVATITAGQSEAVVTIDVPATAIGSAPDKWLMVDVAAPAGTATYNTSAQSEIINDTPVAGAAAEPVLMLLPTTASVASSNGAVLASAGGTYTLDLGNVAQNTALPQFQFSLGNMAGVLADEVLSAITSISGTGFTFSGSAPTAAIAGGGAYQNLYLTADTATLGAQSETLVFSATDFNSTGYTAALPDLTLTVKDNIVAATASLTLGIDAPTSAAVTQSVPGAVGAISLSEPGASLGETFTAVLTDIFGTLSAQGAGVAGAGTNTLTVTGSLAAVNATLATITVDEPAIVADTITLTAHDNLGNVAATAELSVETACYVRGTRITIPGGYAAIEDLRVGDLVVTMSGQHRPVIWIGHRNLNPSKHPKPHAVEPVVIRKGAFGKAMPRRDLWVSPGHAVLVDGILIQAEKLLNGCTVERPPCRRVEYWHIELANHDIVFAEGMPAETYLDTGNRTAFVNGGAFLELHPDFRPRHWRETCIPLATEGANIESARAALQEQVAARGFATTPDPDIHLVADGVRIDPVFFAPDRLAFGLRHPAARIALHSRSFVPAEFDGTCDDMRRLGICVADITVDGQVWDLKNERHFAKGWHAREDDGHGSTWRWTSGTTSLGSRRRLIQLRLANGGMYHIGPTDELSREKARRKA